MNYTYKAKEEQHCRKGKRKKKKKKKKRLLIITTKRFMHQQEDAETFIILLNFLSLSLSLLSSQPTYNHDALSLDPTESFLERALDLPFSGVEPIFGDSPSPLHLRIIPPFPDGKGRGLLSSIDRRMVLVSDRRRVRPTHVHFVFAQVPHSYDLYPPAGSIGAVPDLFHISLSLSPSASVFLFHFPHLSFSSIISGC
jgi:hypothetical protein